HNREVIDDKISVDIPEIDNFLTDYEGNAFSIAVYVEGEFLDANVNEERTAIHFHKGEVEFPDQTTQEELRKAITQLLATEFDEQISALSQIRLQRVKEFVATHPRYKQLLKYKPEKLKTIPSTYNDERLELEVFKI